LPKELSLKFGNVQTAIDDEAWYQEWWSKEKDNVLTWNGVYEIYQQQQAAKAAL